jgi:hypothetical protein
VYLQVIELMMYFQSKQSQCQAKFGGLGAEKGLTALPEPNGASPEAGLIQGADGNFYGTTTGPLF